MLELALRNKIKISKKLIFRHFCTHLFTFLSYLSAWLIKKKKIITWGKLLYPLGEVASPLGQRGLDQVTTDKCGGPL